MSAATVLTNNKRRVLVVDDEENVAHLVASALRFDGFEVRTVDSGGRQRHCWLGSRALGPDSSCWTS